MTYEKAIRYLYDLRLFGAKLGLENTLRLARLTGNPQGNLRFIHVAGTNGKGSTCAMLESIYRAAGLRVGLFTSPHLVSFRERLQINRHPIPETEVVDLVSRMRALITEFPPGAQPTFFEAVTVMALVYFRARECDLVIWETGLGGRLDATNIVTPVASVITNIEFDHEKWLGETLDKIAEEKAGIIKPGVPVVTTTDEPSALEVIRRKAHREHASLTVVTRQDTDRPPLDTVVLPLLGEHQRMNAALAVATVRVLNDVIRVEETAIRTGLATVQWAGRLQIVTTPMGQQFVLDGAHNPQGVQSLCDALRIHFPDAEPTLIFGVLQDKDWATMARILVRSVTRVYLTPVSSSERSANVKALASAFVAAKPSAKVMPCNSLAEALERASGDRLVVITGSLHFVGEAMELLKLSSTPATDEKPLNDWVTP
jgi:dihydrofolate synthase/folylpolyglutamate synthase